MTRSTGRAIVYVTNNIKLVYEDVEYLPENSDDVKVVFKQKDGKLIYVGTH